MNPTVTTARHHLFALGMALLLSTASASVFAGSWFGGDTVKGNGIVRKQDRPLAHFAAIELSLPAQVEVRIGATESVTIEADENILPLVDTRIEDGALQLRTTKRNVNLEPGTLKIIVNAKEIRALAVGGSGNMTVPALRSPKLDLAIGGSGSIDVKQLQSDRVEAAIGGSGNVKVGGTARKFSVTIGGSGDVQARELKADEVEVSIGGSGSATLWPVSMLRTSIAGSGDVKYYGDPVTKSTIVGSGSVKRMGAAPN